MKNGCKLGGIYMVKTNLEVICDAMPVKIGCMELMKPCGREYQVGALPRCPINTYNNCLYTLKKESDEQ